MTRKRFSEREVIETLAWQSFIITCFRCHEPFIQQHRSQYGNLISITWLRKPEREHLHEFELDGPDTPMNCRYSCADCHSVITNGAKATSAGSSKQRIAKVRRILNPKLSKRPMKSSGKKIPSRPFRRRTKP